MKTYFIGLVFLSVTFFSNAQGISAYADYRNYFYAYENNNTFLLETLPVLWYKVSKNSVVYLDNSSNLKAYYKGQKYDLADGAPSNCISGDVLTTFFSNRILKVFDRGKTTMLAGWTTNYVVGDSIVGCLDQNGYTFKIYYNGQTTNLPDGLDESTQQSFVAGDNLLAYKSIDGYFKVYYNNQVYNTEVSQVTNYKAAANTVAFVNESSQEFNLFYKGTTQIIERNAPQSFTVADDMVAYVDNSGSLNVIYMGQKIQLTSFPPQFYKATDNILAYSDNQNFTIFYKGKIYPLTNNYLPEEFTMDFNTLIYVDFQGYLNAFSEGKSQQVTYEKGITYDLFGNTVRYTNSMREIHFYTNGQTY